MLKFSISPHTDMNTSKLKSNSLAAMAILWVVTLIWAISFSLIGVYLNGRVDSYLAVFIRVFMAFLILLPFFRPHVFPIKKQVLLVLIGGVQVGATYLLLYNSFAFLTVPEVLLFTIFTPLWITLIDEFIINRRPLPKPWWFASLLAVLGAAVIRYEDISSHALQGFLLIQAANFCFAAGQVAYKRLPLGSLKQQSQVFACFFLGASLVSGLGVLLFANWTNVPNDRTEWLVLIWLAVGASALGYLAWSAAIKHVNTGQVATMNNMLIPMGILINFLFWNSDIKWARLLIGATIIGLSVWLCSRHSPNNKQLSKEDTHANS